MRKIVIVLLICLGAILGYGLARKNQRLFELPYPKEELQDGKTDGEKGFKAVQVGMDMWQVKEIVGPPLKRIVISEKPQEKKEIWSYENQRLYFENGYLKNKEQT